MVTKKKPKPRRTTAETRPRDADRSQRDILAAALQEFAEFGLGGARIDRIAERAGVNKRMIYYYFGTRRACSSPCSSAPTKRSAARSTSSNLTQVEPAEAIRRLIAFTWNYYLEHPEFLDAAQQREPAPRAAPEAVARRRARCIRRWSQIARRRAGARRARAACSAPASTRCSSTSRSPGCRYFYLGNAHTLSTIFDRDLLAPKAAARAAVAHDRSGAGLPGARRSAGCIRAKSGSAARGSAGRYSSPAG